MAEVRRWNDYVRASRKAVVAAAVDELVMGNHRSLSGAEKICITLGVMFLEGELGTRESDGLGAILDIFS